MNALRHLFSAYEGGRLLCSNFPDNRYGNWNWIFLEEGGVFSVACPHKDLIREIRRPRLHGTKRAANSTIRARGNNLRHDHERSGKLELPCWSDKTVILFGRSSDAVACKRFVRFQKPYLNVRKEEKNVVMPPVIGSCRYSYYLHQLVTTI